MARKELVFKALLDHSDFDQALDQIQRKFQTAQAAQSQQNAQIAQRMQKAGVPGSNQLADNSGFLQQRQAVNKMMEEQAKLLSQAGKDVKSKDTDLRGEIDKRKSITQEVERLGRQQEKLVKGSNEELAVAKRIADEKKKQEESESKIRSIQQERVRLTNEEADAQGNIEALERVRANQKIQFKDIKKAYDQGSEEGGVKGGLKNVGQLGKEGLGGATVKGVASVVGALADAAMVGGQIYGNVLRRQIDTESARGSAIQGTVGKELGSAFSGTQTRDLAFMPEKAQAAEMAQKALDGARVRDNLKSFGNLVLQSATGAAVGFMFGGPIGSAVGAAAGVGRALSDKDTMNQVLSPVSESANAAVQQKRAEEFAKNFQEALGAQQAQNPLKTMSVDYYNQNYTRNLDFQRSLGLDNKSFHGPGGFREQAINAGFSDDMAMGASGQILAAGGSTRGARNSVLGLQASRGADLTNANQILGVLSSGLGSSEATRQTFVKMMAEGSRQGLDSSEYREENRKFMEATAQVVQRSGSSSSTDLERLISQFGGFNADKTPAGMQAASSAFQYFNDQSSQSTGPRGVLRAAGLMNGQNLSKMNGTDLAKLSGINASELSEDHPVVQDLADKYGVDAATIVKEARTANENSFVRRGVTTNLRDKIIKAREGMQGMADTDKTGAQEGINKMQNSLFGELELENPGLDRRQLQSLTEGITQASPEKRSDALKQLEAAQNKKLEGAPGTRVEDETVKAAAESARLVYDAFAKTKDQVVVTAQAVAAFNAELVKTVEAISKMPKDQQATLFGQISTGLYGNQSKNQSQSSKPSK